MMLRTLCLAVLLVPGLALTMRNMKLYRKGSYLEGEEGDALGPKFEASPDLAEKVNMAVESTNQADSLKAQDNAHFRMLSLIVANLESNEFNKGEGCGAQVPEFARNTMLMGLSQLTMNHCAGTQDTLLESQHLASKLWQHLFVLVEGKIRDDNCPEFSKSLKEFSFCLHRKLEKEMDLGQNELDLIVKDKKTKHIMTRHSQHQLDLKQRGAGNLLQAARMMATSDPEHYGNWCGCNSCAHPEEDKDTLPTKETSFAQCAGDMAKKAFDKKNEVCADHGLDAACLRHDYGAEDLLSPAGPVLQCEVNRNFLADLEAIPDKSDFYDGQKHEKNYKESSKTWVSLQACLQWDEKEEMMKTLYPHGDFSAIEQGKCHPKGCYLKY